MLGIDSDDPTGQAEFTNEALDGRDLVGFKKQAFAPSRIVIDKIRSYPAAV